MIKRLLIAGFAAAALAPLAAQASGGVVVSVSTPEFGFRIGGPVYGPPVYAPLYAPPPIVVATPRVVYSPPGVYAPPVVYPPRLVYRPVVVAPRVIYRRAYVPPPRVIVPYGKPSHEHDHHGQQVAYWVSGNARRD